VSNALAKAVHIVVAGIMIFIITRLADIWFEEWVVYCLWGMFGLYAMFVLFASRKANPDPFSKAANIEYDAYSMYCGINRKQREMSEYNRGEWRLKIPYPIEVMAAICRMLNATLGSFNSRSLSKFKKYEAETAGFVDVCKKNNLNAEDILNRVLPIAWPDLRENDRRVLYGRIKEPEGNSHQSAEQNRPLSGVTTSGDLPPKAELSDSQMDGLFQIIYELSRKNPEFLGLFPHAIKRGYLLYYAAFVDYTFSGTREQSKVEFVDKLGIDAKAFNAAWDYVIEKHEGDLRLMGAGGLSLWALRRFGMTIEEHLEDLKEFEKLNQPT
jgi:hypothetical protein